MLKEFPTTAPVARSDAASRVLDAVLVGSTTSGPIAPEDLPAFLFIVDLGAVSTLGRPITDLPWVHHIVRLEAGGWDFPQWAEPLRGHEVREVQATYAASPGTAFLSGIELALIRKVARVWSAFGEPDRTAARQCAQQINAVVSAPERESSSLWDVRRLRTERVARVRDRLAGLSLASAPPSTQTDEEAEAIGAAVLDTILSHSA